MESKAVEGVALVDIMIRRHCLEAFDVKVMLWYIDRVQNG